MTDTAAPDELHRPARPDGWTSCFTPSAVPYGEHPDNCIHSSHGAYRAAGKVPYTEYRDARAAQRAARERFAFEQAIGLLSARYALPVEEIHRRLTGTPDEPAAPGD